MADDFLSFWNLFRISDVDVGSKNQELLGDLRDRAQYLAKKTGQEPVSFYEFKMNKPQQQPKFLRNIGVGALAGAALGAFFSLPGMMAGLFLGGLFGAFADTQNMQRGNLVKAYSNYLDNFELTVARQKTMVQDMSQDLRNDFAERVRASQQATQSRTLT